jgi:lipoate-protein ligase A
MTDLADEEWRIIAEESHDGPLNMALDEIAAETAASGGPRTLRVYRWEPSTLSLGYNQDPVTVDWDFCEQEGITVTRRPTGGGAIYHDSWGDVSYSIVVPADEVPGDLMECYELLCEPVLSAFGRMGVDAGFADEERPAVYEPACYLRALHPAHDVVGPDGRKVSGNAQYRQRDAVVQHGSLTFSTNPERHCACFTGAAGDADQRTNGPDPDAFDDRVGGIDEYADIDRTEVVDALSAALTEWADADEGAWTDEELARARDLAERKHETDAWTRDGEDPT